MLRQIHEAFAESHVGTVAVPPSCWMMNDESVSELVDWATGQRNVRGILLIGHSQGGTPADMVQLAAAGQTGTANGHGRGISSVLDRVQGAQANVRKNEEHFLQELDYLRQTPSVQHRLMQDPGLMQGLFYRAESGVFCVFDQTRHRFRSLLSSDCLG
jgi:carbonic anhydrase